MSHPDPPAPCARGWLWAAGAGIAALAVYVKTLAPGLVGVIDTPMFQFIGKVLGVAHNPGYPLYVLLTYPLAHLPLGSLAYRINLFSAVCGALTVGLTVLAARQLGCRTVVSVAVALALAFGHVYWSQAVIAEVYTLHTVLLAGLFVALLAWRRTGRPWLFYAAIGLFAAGLGLHVTIVGVLPGMVVFAFLTDRTFVLQARTLLTSAAIVSAGLLQYLFVLVRSGHPDAYVESRASSLGELIGVMGGAQFADRLFVFGWQGVLFERLPWIAREILLPELTPAGLVLAAAGAAVLVRRQRPEAILLGGCAIATVGFAANYSVIDTPVFLIPAVLVLWLLAAGGTERLARQIARVPGGRVLPALLLLVPAWLLVQNYAVTDRSHDTQAAIAFDRLFEAIPDRVAFVHEDFLVDRMVMFKVLGDPPAHDPAVGITSRRAEAVQARLDEGRSVLAFPNGAAELRLAGWHVDYGPLHLLEGPPSAFLDRLPRDMLVALAVPAIHLPAFLGTGGDAIAALAGALSLPVSRSTSLSMLGTSGRWDDALARIGAAHDVIEAQGIQVEADVAEAAIRRGARDLVRTSAGAALAVWDAEGRLQYAAVLPAEREFAVPVPPGPLSVHAVRDGPPRHTLAAEWTPVEEAARTGTLLVHVPGGGDVELSVANHRPLLPRVIDRTHDGLQVEIAATDEASSPGAPGLPYAARIHVVSTGEESGAALIALGGVPAYAAARSIAEGEGAAALQPVDTAGLLRLPDPSTEHLVMSRDHQAQLAGHGWSAVDFDEVTPYRWMTGTEAELVLPIAGGDPRAIRVQARLREEGQPQTIAIRVNGITLDPLPLEPGWHAYEWALPPGMGPGVHEVTIVVDEPPARRDDGLPPHDVAVTDLRVLHGPA